MIWVVKDSKADRKNKIHAAKRFARGAMTCPSCQYILEEGVPECPKCGFSGSIAVKKFPFPAPPLSAVVDPNAFLSEQEAAAITKKVGKLQARLPQVHFVNCLVPLGDEVNLREFGFWLLNAGQMEEGDAAKAFAVVFIIDPKNRAISVTVGYGLEPMVMDTEWVKICESYRDFFYRQKYSEGIELFLDKSFELLSERALKLRKEAKK